MHPISFDLIAELALDPAYGWSIGSFGAIGEFVRDADEPVTIHRETDRIDIVTARGAMRIAPADRLAAVAWDSLSADGESWGHALAFCVPQPEIPAAAIRSLGVDGDALRAGDRKAALFDLGVGCGAVRMCLRTLDDALIDLLRRAEGEAMLGVSELMGEVPRAQPHRVMLSPAGRIEIFQPIPPTDGTSPIGPHTHLLPKLILKNRPHSANVPIAEGWQSALSMHPRSPWRTMLGDRHPYDPLIDASFAPLLERFASAEDREVDAALRDAIGKSEATDTGWWPQTRRGRARARILLRRLAVAGDDRVGPWRILHDRAPVETVEGEDG